MKVVLYRHKGFLQCLIKWQTRSEYSHAALLFEDGTLIEATWPKVRLVQNPASDPQADCYYVIGLTSEQEISARQFAEAQVGKPYDLTMVVRFVTRRQESRKSKGKWFCSELVFAALKHADFRLLERIEPWAVSPELLSLSPLLLASEVGLDPTVRGPLAGPGPN